MASSRISGYNPFFNDFVFLLQKSTEKEGAKCICDKEIQQYEYWS